MINLYNKDCLEAMREMEDNAFDLAIVDPPYGIGDTFISHTTGNKPQKLKRIQKIVTGKQSLLYKFII